MIRLLLVAVLPLALTSRAMGQDDPTNSSPANTNIAADFAETSAATVSAKLPRALPPLDSRSANSPSFAEAQPSTETAEPSPAPPDPKFVYGGRDDFRWQLALGVALVRFRSSLFYATGVGTSTSVTYFTNNWFGVEGNVNTAFAPTIFLNEHVKYVGYGGGPKISWRARKWEPWAHTLVGGIHILPRTAGHSENGFGLQVGGGVDYRFYPHLSARLEGDWVKTHVFGEWQNSAQASLDIVLHF